MARCIGGLFCYLEGLGSPDPTAADCSLSALDRAFFTEPGKSYMAGSSAARASERKPYLFKELMQICVWARKCCKTTRYPRQSSGTGNGKTGVLAVKLRFEGSQRGYCNSHTEQSEAMARLDAIRGDLFRRIAGVSRMPSSRFHPQSRPRLRIESGCPSWRERRLDSAWP